MVALYGNELWEFDAEGRMRRREASINDLAIDEADRRIPAERGDDGSAAAALRSIRWFGSAPAGARVLLRPPDVGLELVRGAERPVRIAQQRARQQDRVGRPVDQDLLGLRPAR